jgi:hypothetical protein
MPSLQQHLDDNAISHCRFPDVTIHLANFPPIQGHAIFLSRSPYLNSLLASQPPSPPYTINLAVSDPNLTYEAILNTLHYLYSSSPLPSTLADANTIVSHMAAACVLGVYPSNLVEAYRSILLKSNLTPQNIHPFISFLLSTPHTIHPPTVHPGPYPPFTTGILSQVISYFISTLPLQLQASSITALPLTANTEEYKQMLLPLPFELLKYILEHPQLPIPSEKQRYELSKQIVSKRAAKEKQIRKKDGGPPMEESVVLKVGGENGEGVTLVRSFTRRRSLWKASSNGIINGNAKN